MRSIEVAIAFLGCVLPACGFASDEALFGKVTDRDSGSPSTGGGDQGGAAGADPGQSSGAGGLGGAGPSTSGGNVGAGGRDGSGGGADSGTQGGAGRSGNASCPEGTYHAVLTGSYRSLAGTNDVGATVDFTVIASGALTGTFASRGGAKATVTGSVDCDARALGAKIEDGTYQLGLNMARFSGKLDGTYDPSTGAFDGMWVITETGSTTNGGSGPWSTR